MQKYISKILLLMKKLSKISLHNLSQAELVKREQNMLKGGFDLPQVCIVICSCKYAGEKEGPGDSFYGGQSKDVCQGANQPNVKKRLKSYSLITWVDEFIYPLILNQ